MRALVRDLDANTKQLKRSSLKMSAIPSIIKAIKEQEIKRRKQIKSHLTRIYSEIRDNQVIGSIPDNGFKQKGGGSNRSGKNHAQAIILLSVKLNILITEYEFATFLGVVCPNRGTNAEIKTLVAATILLVDKDIRS